MPALKISKISRAAFAPFGEVIMLDGAQQFAINEGTSQRFNALATADTSAQNGQTILSLFRAQPRTLPLKISMMERHPLGSQAFLPMTHAHADEYLVLVAPAGDFDASQLRAFLCQGFQGVNFAKGVWHHPLIALEKVSDFIVMDRNGAGDNCEETQLEKEFWLTEEGIAAACS